MARPGYVLCLLFFFVLALPVRAAMSAQDASPREIARHIDDLYRGGSSHSMMTVRVFTGLAAREMRVEKWSKGSKYTLARVLDPPDQRDTSLMKLGNSVWSYLPHVDRVIKIPRSKEGSAWMGSHLTNGDIVRCDMLSEDYVAEISFSGLREGTEVIEITLTPGPAASVVWNRVIAAVRQSDLMPLKIACYREDGEPARTITFSRVRELGGRMLPSRILVTPAGNSGEYTEITCEAIRFDVVIDEDFFSLKNLKNPEPLWYHNKIGR